MPVEDSAMKNLLFLFTLLLLFQTDHSLIGASMSPPRQPPRELMSAYTMNGLIPIEYMYVDDTNEGVATHFTYLKADMESIRKSLSKTLLQFESIIRKHCAVKTDTRDGDEHKKTIRSRKDDSTITFNMTVAKNLIHTLPKGQWAPYVIYLHSEVLVQGQEIAIYGSADPWLEIFVLLLGAKHVVTIEYNRLTYEDDRITTISYDQFKDFYSPTGRYVNRFDCIISLSAFDHDGLGRYGDPINPNGDLDSMKTAMQILKPHSGKMILTVPIGPDVVVFNLHRRYGRIRLPQLLQGWNIIETIGWVESRLEDQANWRQTYEPVFMLTPTLNASSKELKKDEL